MKNNNKKYFFTTIFFIIFGLLIVACTNIFIDPLNIHNSPRIKNINYFKPEAYNYTRMFKEGHLFFHDPEIILFGTSRIEHGMNSRSFYLNKSKVFNAGIAGSNIEEVAYFFDLAAHNTDMKKAIIGLDFFTFNAFYRLDKLKIKKNYYKYLNFLFSLDALKVSLKTILRQNKYSYNFYNSDGSINITDHYRDYDYEQQTKEFYGVERNFYCFDWRPGPRKIYSSSHENGWDAQDALRKIIKKAHEKNIEVVFFISPIHSRLQELMFFAGLEDEYDSFIKESLKTIEGDKSKDKMNFTLWDFSGFNKYTSSSIESGILNPWFYDGSHYKPQLGEKILKKIFSNNESEQDSFGRLITSENIDFHMQDRKEQRNFFMDANPNLHDDFDIKNYCESK